MTEGINWKIGDIARTKWEPSGLVRILEIEPANSIYDECALIEFVENHPMGYAAGSLGRYQLKELRPQLRSQPND